MAMNSYHSYKDAVRRFYEKRMEMPDVLDPEEHFPNYRKFVDQWEAMRDEVIEAKIAAAPRLETVVPGQRRVATADGVEWRMMVVRGYGIDLQSNMDRLPTLTRLVKECPEVKSATVSFLGPHKHIPVHTGPFPGVLRFHLGLDVPKMPDGSPAAVLTINGVDYSFSDGEYLLWDDTVPHEAVNHSDRPRTALLLDIWRPGMPPSVERLSKVIYGAINLRMRFRGPGYVD